MASKKDNPGSGSRSPSATAVTDFTFFVDSGDSLLDQTKDFPGRIVKRGDSFGIVQQNGSVIIYGTRSDCILQKRREWESHNRGG